MSDEQAYFISWSGPESERVAKKLQLWVPLVLDVPEPWLSSTNLPLGTRFQQELAVQLESRNRGILVVTSQNSKSPWLHFEAGALSKDLMEGRVIPYLVGLKASDLTLPLSQFQAISADRTGTLSLVKTMNESARSQLAEEVLIKRFQHFWPELEKVLQTVGPADPIDFSHYLKKLIVDFAVDRQQPNMPPLKEYYVRLSASHVALDYQYEATPSDAIFDLQGYVQEWIERPSPVEPLMILGEYGTGKTTFSRKLAHDLAEALLSPEGSEAASVDRARIPLLINLRDYSDNIQSLVTHYLDQYCDVDNPRYRLFQQMNEAGRFVVILDGFDEISSHESTQSIENNLRKIEQLAKPRKARVILTGRPEFFISRDEFDKQLRPRLDSFSERFKDFEGLSLTLWSTEQIQLFLRKVVPFLPDATQNWEHYYEKIVSVPGIGDDLAKRAVLLEMIVKTLPEFESPDSIRRSTLYDRYLKKELERQQRDARRPAWLEDEKRFALLRKLAVNTYQNRSVGFAFGEVKDWLRNEPKNDDLSELQLESSARNFLSCSFIHPNQSFKDYSFSHNSIRGYFAALEYSEQLIDSSATEQMIDQDCSSFLSEIMEDRCDREFYRQQVSTALETNPIPSWLARKDNGKYVSPLPGGHEVEMIFVPPGPFVLGAEGYLNPQISVVEKGFWMDRTPVTTEQFALFVEATGYVTDAEREGGVAYRQGRLFRKLPDISWRSPLSEAVPFEAIKDHPVRQVSWKDAQAFCRWAEKALPTEQQWEKAARGIDARQYVWGNDWDWRKCNSVCWWARRDFRSFKADFRPWLAQCGSELLDGRICTTPVGSFADNVSVYGAVDLAGNTWEWCADRWDQRHPEYFVLRGGAWHNPPEYMKCTNRDINFPDLWGALAGFRCIKL